MAYEASSKSIDFAAKATDKGCDLIVTNDTILLIDLDSPAAIKVLERNMPIVRQRYEVTSVEEYTSKGGQNSHAIVRLTKPVTDVVERLLLQAVLGSDCTRELLGLYLHRDGHPTPSVLFRPRIKEE